MSFFDIITRFEAEASNMFHFEVLEKHDSRYLFGSGYAVYRSAGVNFKIVYEGRDRQTFVEISGKHQKYPDCTWEVLFAGGSSDFFDSGVRKLASHLANKFIYGT